MVLGNDEYPKPKYWYRTGFKTWYRNNTNINSHENEENRLNEKVCSNFWPVLLKNKE